MAKTSVCVCAGQERVKKAYACENCGRSYSYRSGLYQHRKHECGKTAQFACHLCTYKASRMDTLRTHFIKHLKALSS